MRFIRFGGRLFKGSLAWRQYVACGWGGGSFDADDDVELHHRLALERAFDQCWAWWMRLNPKQRRQIAGWGDPLEEERKQAMRKRRWGKPQVMR